MFDRFRMAGPALGAARLLGLLGGVALTWACAAFGVMALIHIAFVSYRCPAPTRMAHLRILDVEVGITQHQIVENRCPSPRRSHHRKIHAPAQPRGPVGHQHRVLVPRRRLEIRSAGPDKVFNTNDDITNEQ